MNKSLAKRISKHTRQYVEKQKEERRKQKRVEALKILTEEFIQRANTGCEIFTTRPGELDIDFYSLVMKQISSCEDTNAALKDIGFDLVSYNMGMCLRIPEKNPSVEILNLLQTYNRLRNEFDAGERQKATEDCQAVLQKLEAGDYKIVGIDEISVEFCASSSTDFYTTCVTNMMTSNGFDVDICETCWNICIIRNGGE